MITQYAPIRRIAAARARVDVYLPASVGMSRRRKRSRYAQVATPMDVALYQAMVTPKANLDQLRLIELSSLDSITHGCAKWHDVQRLADACNLGQTLCEFNVGKAEAGPALIAAEMAIIQCAARLERTGKIGLTGEELQAVREMLEYVALQRASISRRELLRAIELTAQRIKQNHGVVDLNQACAVLNGRAA
jgi:hypothetical protein